MVGRAKDELGCGTSFMMVRDGWKAVKGGPELGVALAGSVNRPESVKEGAKGWRQAGQEMPYLPILLSWLICDVKVVSAQPNRSTKIAVSC